LFCPLFPQKPEFQFETQEPNMEAPAALNVAPMNAPHKDFDYLPLADKDFQIKYLYGNVDNLQAFCQIKDNYWNNSDVFGLWESNLPVISKSDPDRLLVRLTLSNYFKPTLG